MQLNKVLALKNKDKLAITVHYSTLVAIAIFVPYYFIVKVWDMFVFDSITAFIFAIISVAYVKKKYYLGKVLTLSATMIFVYLLSFIFLPHEIRMNLFFFLLIISALVIFDYDIKRERITALLFATMNLFLAILSEIFTYEPVFKVTEESIKFQRVTNTAIFGLILGILLFLHNIALAAAEKELERFASIDTLTGIYNRRTLLECGRDIIEYSEEDSENSIVMIFDIDHFKKINDRYGHHAGDVVLIEISQLVQKEIRVEDVFGRYGGEEFVLVSYGTIRQAEILAEKIRTSIEVHPFIVNKSNEIMVTVSIGVCTDSGTNLGLEDLISKADKALYEAKGNGRNRMVMVNV